MVKRELANMNMNATGQIVKAGTSAEKERILKKVIPYRLAQNHTNRLCHIHDLEFYDTTYNCLGLRAGDLINNDNLSFKKALKKLHREIVRLTNLQSGGIGFLNFDEDMQKYTSDETQEELAEELNDFFCDLNMFSRKGCEKAYVTFNFGLSTGEKGRRVAKAMLDAYEKGDEEGAPFSFPNLVFKMKSGVNTGYADLNYDIFMDSLRLTAKRMVPTYFNCDSAANRDASAEQIGIMGCRTRVVDNLYGEKSGMNRGNICCVTLNLVQLAYESVGDIRAFQDKIGIAMEDAKDLLLHRFHTLIEHGDFDELIRMGVYKDSTTCDPETMLRNGTLSIGFIGLWDALSVVYGEKYDTIDGMKKHLDVALHLIRFMRKKTDSYTAEYRYNFSLLASAAEGVTGRFAEDDERYKNKGIEVIGKGYYSNSFHVPVDVRCGYEEKIDLESAFHELCNGGAITYAELDEMPAGNLEAVEEIVRYAYDKGCNYFGINFSLDRCEECGYTWKIIGGCPKCGSKKIKRLRRVSGYLAETDRFTNGKMLELLDRTSHAEICNVTEVL